MCAALANLHRRRGRPGRPLRALFLTLNTALRAYVQRLAESASQNQATVVLRAGTFAKWACTPIQKTNLQPKACQQKLTALLASAAPRYNLCPE